MAVNAASIRRVSDKGLFLTAAIAFPLLVLIGYFKSYYFSWLFDARGVANRLVHFHGVVMTLWVLYFTLQIALVRSKNFLIHMTLGWAGAVLAILVVVSGLLAAYDSHIVRATAPPGINHLGFALVPIVDMTVFVIFFGGAIYYRHRPAEHKTLMLMTAINFLPAVMVRIQLLPQQFMILWAYGVPDLLAIGCLSWHSLKHRRVNKVFLAAVVLMIVSHPLRVYAAGTQTWLKFAAWLASF